MCIAKAQPSPCGATAAMTPTCVEACIICEIPWLYGINNSLITGQVGASYNAGPSHAMDRLYCRYYQWTIELEVFNCRSNDGLEVGIYEAVECKNYKKLVTDCDTDIAEYQAYFSRTKSLTIGQYYFWVMDGAMMFAIIPSGYWKAPPGGPFGNASPHF